MPRKMREYLCETGRSITAEGWPETGYAYRNDKGGLTFHEDILVYNFHSLKMVLGKRSHIIAHAENMHWEKIALTPDGAIEFGKCDALEELEWHDANTDFPDDPVFAELEDRNGDKFYKIIHINSNDGRWHDDCNRLIIAVVLRWKHLYDV